jgi:hypothetical protein
MFPEKTRYRLGAERKELLQLRTWCAPNCLLPAA